MSLNVGSPPEVPKSPLDEWLVRSIKSIELYIQTNDPSVITDGFDITDRSSLISAHTLDQSGATLTDVRNVLATLIDAFRGRGARNA